METDKPLDFIILAQLLDKLTNHSFGSQEPNYHVTICVYIGMALFH
jgi:hypothetical protein